MGKALLLSLKRWLLLALVAGFVKGQNDTVPVVEEEAKAFPYEYGLRDLDNGLRVLVVPTTYPHVVSLNTLVQVGSRNEVEQGKSGFAHFFEHMMFRGTDNYTSDEFFAFYKSIGASINAFTTQDFTSYYATLPSRDNLEAALSLEADRFKYIKYTEEAFKTEAGAILGEYNLRCDGDTGCRLFEVQRNATFTTHPYKHEVIGFVEDIKDMPNQYEHSKDFFDRYYRPEKTSLILVGDLDIEETLSMVEKHWGDWEQGSFVESIPQEPPGEGPVYEHITWEEPTLPIVMVAFRGPAFSDTSNEMATMDVAFSLSFSSRSAFYQKLVLNEQKVADLETSIPDSKDPYLLTVAAALYKVEDIWYVRDEILKTFADLRVNQVSSKSVSDTKSALRYASLNGMDSSVNIAKSLVNYMSRTRDPESINRVHRIYGGITKDDIMSKANTYFTDNNLVVVTLASGEDSLPETSDPGAGSVDSVANTLGEEQELVPAVLQRTDSNLVNFHIRFSVGAMDDPVGLEGLAVLTADMISAAGSATMSYEDIREALFPMAAGFGNSVDKELTSFLGQVHIDSLDDYYDIISRQLLDPGWDEDDFSRIKAARIAAITDGIRDDAQGLGLDLLSEVVFGKDHPYGYLNEGHVKSLESITLENVRTFYQENYNRANLLLGMAGGFSDQFLRKVNTDMNSLPLGNATEHIVPRPKTTPGARAVLIEKETGKTTIQFGFPISVTPSHPDYAALWLINTYFGSGFTSRLFVSVRELRGLSYSPRSYHRYFRGSVLRGRQEQIYQVYISEVDTTETAHFATRVAMFEFNKLINEGIDEEDFEINRVSLLNSINLLDQTQSDLLNSALFDQYYGIEDFASYMTSELSNLTLNRVNEVISDHLQDENVTFVFVTSDAENLRDRLVNETISTATYPSEPSPELLAEDEIISNWPLNFDSNNVQIIPVSQVFETAGGDAPTDPNDTGGDNSTGPNDSGGDNSTDPNDLGGDNSTDPNDLGGDNSTDPNDLGGDNSTDPNDSGGDNSTDPNDPSIPSGDFQQLTPLKFGGCMEADGSSDGSGIRLGTCDSSKASQEWQYDSFVGVFKTSVGSNKCLQAPGSGNVPTNGRLMRVYGCNEDNPFQQFVWSAADGGPIKLAEYPEYCVVFRGVNADVGTDPIILKKCEDIINERGAGWEAI